MTSHTGDDNGDDTELSEDVLQDIVNLKGEWYQQIEMISLTIVHYQC